MHTAIQLIRLLLSKRFFRAWQIHIFATFEHYLRFFIYPAILLEIIAPILLIIGYKTKFSSVLLSGFCVITAIIFLNDFSDQSQLNGFFKNIGLSAGFLFLAINGSKKYSLDFKLAK